jgi:hypothetical protein
MDIRQFFSNRGGAPECVICLEEIHPPKEISMVKCVCKELPYHTKCARQLVDTTLLQWKCPFCRFTHPLPKVYLAGKANSHVRPQRIGCDGDLQEMYGKTEPIVTEEGYVFVGPDMVTVGCDHRCYHNPNVLHCVGHGGEGCMENTAVPKRQIYEASVKQIEQADYVYAILSTPDAYGTLVEIGFAVSKNIPVYINFMCRDGLKRDLWFSEQAARLVWSNINDESIKRYHAIKHLLPFDAEYEEQPFHKPYIASKEEDSEPLTNFFEDDGCTSHVG